MEKYPLLRSKPDRTVLKVLSNDASELVLNNIYHMIEGQVEGFIKSFCLKKKFFNIRIYYYL